MHRRPEVMLFLAVLSIGGLLFLGWQAHLANDLTGNVAADYHTACCSTQEWKTGPTGLAQGPTVTRSVACRPGELRDTCCLRDGSAKTRYPVRLVGSKEGFCSKDAPKQEYPASVPRGQRFEACCSVQTWKHAPTGFTQGVAQTFTGYCDTLETVNQCCVRAGKEFTGESVRLVGGRIGACSKPAPQMAYPIWVR